MSLYKVFTVCKGLAVMEERLLWPPCCHNFLSKAQVWAPHSPLQILSIPFNLANLEWVGGWVNKRIRSGPVLNVFSRREERNLRKLCLNMADAKELHVKWHTLIFLARKVFSRNIEGLRPSPCHKDVTDTKYIGKVMSAWGLTLCVYVCLCLATICWRTVKINIFQSQTVETFISWYKIIHIEALCFLKAYKLISNSKRLLRLYKWLSAWAAVEEGLGGGRERCREWEVWSGNLLSVRKNWYFHIQFYFLIGICYKILIYIIFNWDNSRTF